MRLLFATSVLIAGERREETVKQIIERVREVHGDVEGALSVISIVEITHGIYRARTLSERSRRRVFTEELCRDMVVHPLSLSIAQLPGRIEGEQAAKGIFIAVEDLIIGATALHLGFDVATLNTRHFAAIPGLNLTTI